MITSVIGVSDDIDVSEAVKNVVQQCKDQLKGKKPHVGVLFTSIMEADFTEMLTEINRSFPGVQLIGCTTDGEIVPQLGFVEDAVALLLLSSEEVKFATAIACNISQNPEESFRAAFAECEKQLGMEAAFGITLPDGLSTVSVPLDTIIQNTCGKAFPMFGGTAGDHFRLTRTYQFFKDGVYSDAAPILLMAGVGLKVLSSIETGAEPIGDYYEITSFDKNIVYEINGKKASDFYEEILGHWVYKQQTLQFPLAVYEKGEDECYLRDPLLVNKEDGTATFIGNFPANCRVRLTRVTPEDILSSASKANKSIFIDEDGKKPELIFVFSCTSRRHLLGSQTEKEVAELRLPGRTSPFFGFYCYGEIGPVSPGQPIRFHNDTYVVVSIIS